MKNDIVVKRYAEAFIEYASKTADSERIVQDFKRLREIVRANPEFVEFLMSKEVTAAEKSDLVSKALENYCLIETNHLLQLLLNNKRIGLLEDIINFIIIIYSYRNQPKVLLKTTFLLNTEMIRKIKNSVEETIGRKCRFYIGFDGELLGGIQITVGNIILDGSVKQRLSDLKEKLKLVRI